MTAGHAGVSAMQRLLIGAVRLYRWVLSPWLGSSCRFTPSCSAYAIEAIECHGAAVGTYLTLGRLMRCQPLCEGGHDPVSAAHFFTARQPESATRSVVAGTAERTDKKLP
jgi:uncharacterized protein